MCPNVFIWMDVSSVTMGIIIFIENVRRVKGSFFLQGGKTEGIPFLFY